MRGENILPLLGSKQFLVLPQPLVHGYALSSHRGCYQTIIVSLLKKYSNFVFHRHFYNLCPLDTNGLT
jgi:hypothetical protein